MRGEYFAVAAKHFGLTMKEALLLTPSTFHAMLSVLPHEKNETISEEVL